LRFFRGALDRILSSSFGDDEDEDEDDDDSNKTTK
jgi:hypothetical protein